MSRKPFFMFFADDYLAGTRGLKDDQARFYIDCLALMWSRQSGLPVNRHRMARLHGCSSRKSRRLTKELLAEGKLVIINRTILNNRMAAQLEITESLPEVSKEFDESLQQVCRKFARNFSKKLNEINTKKSSIPEPYPEPYPERKQTPSKQPDSVTETQADSDNPLAGLNGATDLVIADLARWINPTFPDTITARGSLETNLKLFGAPIVKRAYGELKAKIDSGDLIARPIPLLHSICQRIEANPGQRPNTRQTQQDKVAAAIAAAKQGAHGHA